MEPADPDINTPGDPHGWNPTPKPWRPDGAAPNAEHAEEVEEVPPDA